MEVTCQNRSTSFYAGALELGVLGLVHHAHAATAELFEYVIVGNGLANHGEGPAFGGHRRACLVPQASCQSLHTALPERRQSLPSAVVPTQTFENP